MLAIAFPAIDPVAVELGPLVIRWYALAYIVGIFLGWRYARFLAARGAVALNVRQIDDILFAVALGVIFGGRIGYVLFYKFSGFLADPLMLLRIWEGGMSFHGGVVGVGLACLWFARKEGAPLLAVADAVLVAVPPGLFFGRIANFINGELFGRVTDVPWAVYFPRGGPDPRHPSQLYEGFLEGLVLFAVLAWVALAARGGARSGLLSGIFLAGYGAARTGCEFFREPDAHIGFLLGGATYGQLLSLPMVIAGIWLIARARRPGKS